MFQVLCYNNFLITLAECFDKETSRRFIIVVFPDSRELKCLAGLAFDHFAILGNRKSLEIVLLVFIMLLL